MTKIPSVTVMERTTTINLGIVGHRSSMNLKLPVKTSTVPELVY